MRSVLTSIFLLFSTGMLCAQNLQPGEIHGNFQTDIQNYYTDTLIGAKPVAEKIRMNGFANLIYTKGNFSAGLRYEAYLNPLLGYDERYRGNGIMYRFASYKADELEFTVGSFYEQYGSGLILRSYEERNIGIDNALDGIKVKYTPWKGIQLKGLVGKQRSFFGYGPGLVRGADAEISLNEALFSARPKKVNIILGGSGVSRYQADLDPFYRLPQNVAAGAGRINLVTDKINIYTEYAGKINDPSDINNFIYKNGEALFVGASYSTKGFSFSTSGKRIDNMDFRSDRAAQGNVLMLNYLPAGTRQHTYQLAAFYPYATRTTGEIGFQSDLAFTYKKGSVLGGKYGTLVSVNYSRIHDIKRAAALNDTLGYTSSFFDIAKELFYEEATLEVQKKISQKLKTNLMLMYQVYNKDAVQGLAGYGTIYSYITVADISYKLSSSRTIRTELQHLLTAEDKKSWAMGLAEYTVSPHWFVAAYDLYNYGNTDAHKRIHYYSVSGGYTKNATRIALGYGKQREGIVCVGGICRNLPASNGVSLSISTSF
jgi:hypothetical protein